MKKGTISRNPVADADLPKTGKKPSRIFAEALVKPVMAAASRLRSQALV